MVDSESSSCGLVVEYPEAEEEAKKEQQGRSLLGGKMAAPGDAYKLYLVQVRWVALLCWGGVCGCGEGGGPLDACSVPAGRGRIMG